MHLLGVDNVLAKPADPLFMGFANSRNCDIACKFVAKVRIIIIFFEFFPYN